MTVHPVRLALIALGCSFWLLLLGGAIQRANALGGYSDSLAPLFVIPLAMLAFTVTVGVGSVWLARPLTRRALVLSATVLAFFAAIGWLSIFGAGV